MSPEVAVFWLVLPTPSANFNKHKYIKRFLRNANISYQKQIQFSPDKLQSHKSTTVHDGGRYKSSLTALHLVKCNARNGLSTSSCTSWVIELSGRAYHYPGAGVSFSGWAIINKLTIVVKALHILQMYIKICVCLKYIYFLNLSNKAKLAVHICFFYTDNRK